jgi:hypothetical protein
MCSQEFLRHVDNNNRVIFHSCIVEHWCGQRFDVFGCVFLASVIVCTLMMRIFQHTLSTADIALVLSFSLNLMSVFQWTIR